MKSSNVPVLAGLAFVLLQSQGAGAAQVSFTGGFTSFSGPVATLINDQAAVQTKINGQVVYADTPLPGAEQVYTDYGIGTLNGYALGTAANPATTVDFSRVFYSGLNPNSITFTPSGPVELTAGSVFKLGTLTATNGSWFGNNPGENFYPPTSFSFSVTTHSSDPTLNGIVYSDTLKFVVTTTSDPNATIADDADYFYFADHADLGTLSVYEKTDPQGNPNPTGNTGSVDLMAKIGSLIPVGLTNATGAAFVGNQVSAVPEPGSMALLLAGLAAVWAFSGPLRSAGGSGRQPREQA